MKRNVPSIVVAATLLLVGGCGGCGGGSLSQSEMIRLAKERKKAQQAGQAKVETNSAPPANGTTPRPAPPPKTLPENAPTAEKSAVSAPTAAPTPRVEQQPLRQDLPPAGVANQKPKKPLADAERRQRTIENLQRIGQALNRYQSDKGCFPAPAIYDERLSPLLSWRVELLPFLGYEDLYKQFRLDQPWDSPHNRDLLPLIPPAYQSPERFDERTNYVVLLGSGTAFPGRRGVRAKDVEDGVADTVLLLEVDDELAVPWTQPSDYRVNYAKPAEGMGDLRGGHFFAVWGDGTIGQIPLEKVAKCWKAMTSIDGGEPFSASQISQPPVAEPAPSTPRVAVAPADTKNAVAPPANQLEEVGVSPKEPPGESRRIQPSVATPEEDPTLPVPDEKARRLARRLFREIFQSEYEEAVTDEEKRKFAEKIRARADQLQEDPAGRYVLLDISAVISAQAGSVIAALEVVEAVKHVFRTDGVELEAKVLEASAGLALSTEENEAALEAASGIIDQAIAADNYDLATRMVAVALAAARRSGDKRLTYSVVERKDEIASAKLAFLQVAHLVDALAADPADAVANRAVGEYYCFVKGQWEDGLRMLSRGADLRLARLAERDLKGAENAREMLALADGWWEASHATSKHHRAMRNRAAYWYQQALPDLSASLERVKAEIRIKQTRLAASPGPSP